MGEGRRQKEEESGGIKRMATKSRGRGVDGGGIVSWRMGAYAVEVEVDVDVDVPEEKRWVRRAQRMVGCAVFHSERRRIERHGVWLDDVISANTAHRTD